MLFQLFHVQSADRNHHPATLHTQRRSCLHISQLTLMRDGRFPWEDPLYQVLLLLSSQSGVISRVLVDDIIFVLGEENIHSIPFHSCTCKLEVWLHQDAACFFPSLSFWLLCSCFMIASILLMPSFVSHRLSSSSPFIFLIVFFMWLGEEVRQKPKTFFLPIMLTNIHLSVIFLCSFPCLWLFFSHSHLLLCLPPFPPLIFALPHQLLLQMHPKVDFIFQTLLLRGLSIVQRGGGRSQRSCSWLVRMRLLSSALHLSTSFILTRWLCWTLAWKVLFLRLHLHIDRKKVTHYGCRSQACL